MPTIFLVVHLMSVPQMYPKLLTVCKLLRLLHSNDFYEASSCLCALKIIKSHTTCHILHLIMHIFHTEYLEQLIIFCSCLKYSDITEILILKVSTNKVPRNSFRLVKPILDQSSCIYTFVFELCNTFGHTKSTVKTTSFPVPKIVLYIINIKLTVLLNS